MIENSKLILCTPEMKNNLYGPQGKKAFRIYIFISLLAFLLSGIYFSLDASTESTPHTFPLSESELRNLAKALAPKVDLFREVWEKDPEAEFFAGTTRDYLYWILGHFKGLENLDSSTNGMKQSDARLEKIEAIKNKLLAIPFIKFNEIVGPESDADIMTKNRRALEELRAEDFAIRKLDFISFDRALPGNPMYQDEIDQGYIPSEKIRLSKKGITTDSSFGNGVADLVSGNLSIQFPDRNKFWKTHYAKEGANHPLLLTLRYVRILAQDYLQRHGSEIPDARKLEAPMTKEIKLHIQKLIQDAITDTNGSFGKLLQNKQGKKWLNSSIQKSFRSFTNANAAFELMKELGLLGLIEVYPDQIESVHQYLLKTKRDEGEIAENFKKFGITPDDLYEKLENYLPDLELYHGTESELAFRNIIYQGVIPSTGGSAGRGLYGVSQKDLEFAKSWSKEKSGQDDLVIALTLKPSTKIVDITKGTGKVLFEQWRESKIQEKSASMNYYSPISSITASAQSNSQTLDLHDAFAHDFGVDILRYPYNGARSIEAFVLKNSEVIERRRGAFKNPRPISELLSEAEKARINDDLSFLKDFLETPLTKDERNKIFSLLGEDYLKKALSHHHFRDLRKLLGHKIVSLCESLLASPLTKIHSLVWKIFASLLKDPRDIHLHLTDALKNQSDWPASFWKQVPRLLKDPRDHVRSYMCDVLQAQKSWPSKVWSLVPTLLKYPQGTTLFTMTLALKRQSKWPTPVWKQIINLMQSSNRGVRWNTMKTLATQKSWPSDVWDLVPILLRSKDQFERSSMMSSIADQTTWTPEVWNLVPSLLKDPVETVRSTTAFALQGQVAWPKNVWDLVHDLMQDTEKSVRSNIALALRNQKSWPDSFWTQVLDLVNHPNDNVRWQMAFLLWNYYESSWHSLFWKHVPSLLKNKDDNKQARMKYALGNQPAWPQEVIDLVNQSTDPIFNELKKLKPSVLDLSSCARNLSEVSDQPPQASSPEKPLP